VNLSGVLAGESRRRSISTRADARLRGSRADGGGTRPWRTHRCKTSCDRAAEWFCKLNRSWETRKKRTLTGAGPAPAIPTPLERLAMAVSADAGEFAPKLVMLTVKSSPFAARSNTSGISDCN